jgi:TfoX/Sxy family transcriptional regulator of competence genes
MTMAKWKRAPEEVKEILATAVSKIDCTRKIMFGYPAYFINNNMFTGVYQDSIIIRLDAESQERLLSAYQKIKRFEPMKGRIMKEYLEVPKSFYSNEAILKEFVITSYDYASSLPAKPIKKRKSSRKKVSNITK